MGTMFSITLYAETRPQAEAVTQTAFDRIAQLEDVLSDYMADSELRLLSEAPVGEPTEVGDDLLYVLQRGSEIAAMTDGAFDLTAGPFTRLWRFSRKRGTLPSEADLAVARKAVGWQEILLNMSNQTAALTVENMRLDAGGFAKGYAADEAMKVLKAQGIDRALVAASGDILTSLPPPGTEGWTVTIAGTGIGESGPRVSRWVSSGVGVSRGRTSRHGGSSIGLSVAGEVELFDALPPQTLLIRNAAISTSGDTAQSVEIDGVRYSHIVSPFTGLGLTNRIQATVIAPDAATSDALATACCVLGPERAVALADSIPGVSVIVVTKDGDRSRIWRSRDAP